MIKLYDKYDRRHNYLRISLTDKCNFNCYYCNPSLNCNKSLRKNEILDYEEISRLITIFTNNGFSKIRLTGGEPFARKNIINLFDKIKIIKENADFPFELSITTNGSLIKEHINVLKSKGLDRINFSLDSLNREIFKKITGSNNLDIVIENINAAKKAGFENIKINTVILKGINDKEIGDFCEFALQNELTIRFIEYMPIGQNGWNNDLLLSSDDIKRIVKENYYLKEFGYHKGVARNYHINDGIAQVGFISPITNNFCSGCNRLRITSDGKLKLCLFEEESKSMNILNLLRDNTITDNAIIEAVNAHLYSKNFERKPLEELLMIDNDKMINIGG